MTHTLNHRALVALAITQALFGCSRFVWKEDPFTPDQAPVTEIVASGRDTTYILHGSSYYLLAQQRSLLWSRDVVDDVAWRYRALFGEAPPDIALKLDSVATLHVTDTTWRGLPLATVGMKRRPIATGGRKADERDREEAGDTVRARLVMSSSLAATAAETWLEARALGSTRQLESEPGGPERPVATAASLPAWMQAGALRIMANGGAPDRAAAELRANQKGIVPLATLFTVRWESKPNAVVGVSPLFIAQSVSVLAFIHERDPGLIVRLSEDLPRGGSFENALASSTTLPRDLAGFESAWRNWLKQTARRK